MAMPKPKKNKKTVRTEGAVEATLALRLNNDGALVDYECGNPDCMEQLQKSEEVEFKDGKVEITAGDEVECEKCGTVNFNEGFTISRL